MKSNSEPCVPRVGGLLITEGVSHDNILRKINVFKIQVHEIVNPLGICWIAAKEKNLWQYDQVKQNILRFRLYYECSSYPQTLPISFGCGFLRPRWLCSCYSVLSRREGSQPCPVQSAAGGLSDQNSSTGQSSPLGDKQFLTFWETNWLWKSSVCRARLQGKIEREARMGHSREKGIKMEEEKDGKEE